MKLKIREGTISDDGLCGAIMLGALVSARYTTIIFKRRCSNLTASK